MESKVDLTLGSSSRYLFKVSSMPENVMKVQGKESTKLLTVINYKGTKMAIIVFELCSDIETI